MAFIRHVLGLEQIVIIFWKRLKKNIKYLQDVAEVLILTPQDMVLEPTGKHFSRSEQIS